MRRHYIQVILYIKTRLCKILSGRYTESVDVSQLMFQIKRIASEVFPRNCSVISTFSRYLV